MSPLEMPFTSVEDLTQDASDIVGFAIEEMNSEFYAAIRGTGLWRANASSLTEDGPL